MINKIKELIDNSNSIVLLTHENPDGDAIGSVMAFYYMLTDIDKSVDIVIPEVPKLFNFIKDINKSVDKSNKNYDLAIVLDCANTERIGSINNEISRCTKIISIDHHVSNSKYGNLNYVVSDSPACCQVIYYLFKKWKIKIDNLIGTALMIGLLTDTCGFRNNNVNKDTFLMAADFYDLGINIYKLYDMAITRKSMANCKLKKMVLDRLEFFEDGKIAFSYITKEDMDNCGAALGDHEGLVDIGRNIFGVEVSIFIREQDSGIYSISFRSNGKVLANKLATIFNGGGHDMAAGAKIMMPFNELKDKVIEETVKALAK